MFTNSSQLNKNLLNEKWIKNVTKKEIKDFPELNENEYTPTYGVHILECGSKRQFHSIKCQH